SACEEVIFNALPAVRLLEVQPPLCTRQLSCLTNKANNFPNFNQFLPKSTLTNPGNGEIIPMSSYRVLRKNLN
ncbi:MAG: hypothetical protein AB8I58_22215, partial [Anaerolineales bacterium]